MIVDLLNTTNVTLVVKANNLRDALSYLVVKAGRNVFYNYVGATEAGVIGQYTITITVPTETVPTIRYFLNDWMAEDANVNAPYPNGSLLFYASHIDQNALESAVARSQERRNVTV